MRIDEDVLARIERILVRIILLIVIIFGFIAFYQSCSSSIVFVKGNKHKVEIKEGTDAAVDVEDIDLALRKVESKQDEHEERITKHGVIQRAHDSIIAEQGTVQVKIVDTLKQSKLLVKDSLDAPTDTIHIQVK